MKKLRFYLKCGFVICLMSLLFLGCENSNEGTDDSGTSKIMVRLTDAPGDYDEVNIDVQDVKIKASNEDGDDGWVSIGNITPGVYNLLDLTAGVTVLIAENSVASGYMGQIRLILGENNTVAKDGVYYPLKTPSAQQSGLKLKINQTLLPGYTYDFLLDFDVANSIVKEAGQSGKHILHPVINISTTVSSGAIKGKISPVLVGYQVEASVVVGDVTITAYANEQGNFQLNGVPAGTYTVILTPDVASGKLPISVANVNVINGQVTDIGNISF